MSVNTVMLSGNVGKDPDVKTTESGKKIAKFSLATSDNNKAKTTQWHNITCWEGTAEIAERYVKKGSYVTIIGSIGYREYEGKYYTDITAKQIELPPKRINEPEGAKDPLANKEGQYQKQEAKTSDVSDLGNVGNEDDLPF